MEAGASVMGLSAIGSVNVAQNATVVVSYCRAASSSLPHITSSRLATTCAKQTSCGDEAYAPSRRSLLGLLGALSLSAITAVEHVAVASPSCDFTVAPSGLGFCDASPGTGLPASQGMLIKANYVGKLEDGKVFDSSYDRGKPLTFKIGVGQVIKGWDEGILGGEGVPPMLAGGKRRLRIPPQLGYGDRGAGCRAGSCLIPPNSVLLFDVEFVGKAF